MSSTNHFGKSQPRIVYALEGQLESLQAEIERLRAALKKYGVHTYDCDLPETHGQKPCNCGWSDLIGQITIDTEPSVNEQ